MYESQSMWSVVREWDGISNLGVPRLKSIWVGPRSLVQTWFAESFWIRTTLMDFLPGLVASRIGVLSPNWVNKLSVHFYFPVCFHSFVCISNQEKRKRRWNIRGNMGKETFQDVWTSLFCYEHPPHQEGVCCE